jgi:hypothetical protein
MQHVWNDNGRRNPKYLDKSLYQYQYQYQYHVFHNKPHKD